MIEYKIRHLVLPLLLLTPAFAACYSLLNWLLVAKTGLLPIDEEVVGLWLPGVLSWILVSVLVNPHLRILKLNDRTKTLYYMIAVAIAAIPAMAAQGYVRVATGEITHVKSASTIASGPNTKYYAADSICLDRTKTMTRTTTDVYGRNNESRAFDLFVVVLVCADGAAEGESHPVWIGLKFHTSGANGSNSFNKSEYDDFIRKSDLAFRNEDPARYRYLERVGMNTDRKNFEKALMDGGINISSPTILIPHAEPFDQRTGDRLYWVFGSFGVGLIVWLVLILFSSVDQAQLKHGFKPPKKRLSRHFPDARTLLIPTRSSYGLPILMDVNILVFAAMALSGLGVFSIQPDDLLAWGANFRPAIHGAGVFRLISSQFVHGGVIHIANNLFLLTLTGVFLAPVATNGRLIFCYLVSGLGGSIASDIVHPAIISVGASGAIFGLCGVLLVLLLFRDNRIAYEKMLIVNIIGVLVGINLLLGIFMPGVDYAGHLGGLFTGAGLGTAIFLIDRSKMSRMSAKPCQ